MSGRALLDRRLDIFFERGWGWVIPSRDPERSAVPFAGANLPTTTMTSRFPRRNLSKPVKGVGRCTANRRGRVRFEDLSPKRSTVGVFESPRALERTQVRRGLSMVVTSIFEGTPLLCSRVRVPAEALLVIMKPELPPIPNHHQFSFIHGLLAVPARYRAIYWRGPSQLPIRGAAPEVCSCDRRHLRNILETWETATL